MVSKIEELEAAGMQNITTGKDSQSCSLKELPSFNSQSYILLLTPVQ
jgi:hypothetical protein